MPDRDLSHRACVVTGAGSGIGRATASGLARRGATVLLVCRTKERAEATAKEIRAESGNGRIEPFAADLSRVDDVRGVATEIGARHEAVYALVNNAGVQLWERRTTPDGIEVTFATNVLAPFLLTRLLTPPLERAAPSRVVNVGSVVHRLGRMDWDDLQGERGYDANKAYYQSKLALTLLSDAFARRLSAAGVCVQTVEPGMTRTDFARDFRGFYRLMAWIWRPFMRRPEEVAREIEAMLTDDALDRSPGRYWHRGRPGRIGQAARDRDAAERLWAICERMTAPAPSP
jgi:NAD(P)-dependent dehydrogenase (short-subunit alcohol dehydrogenase family)